MHMLKAQFSFNKNVSYWSSENGQGVKNDGTFEFGTWGHDYSFMNTSVILESIDSLADALIKVLEANYLPHDYFAVMDDGRVSFNTIENGNGDILSPEEQDEYDKRDEQLYICDYDVMIEIQQVYEPNMEQLVSLLPNAEY